MKYTVTSFSSLLDALSLAFPTSSKTTLRSWIKEGRILINGIPIRAPNLTVAEGQEISLTSKRKFISDTIPILYEDKYFVVIDKPAGLLSVSTNFEKKDTAHSLLKNYYHPRKIYVVHRLDQDTSGVMLFAFGEKAGEQLKKIFEVHDIERCYTAIVEGQMPNQKGTWESYLYEDAGYRVHSSSDPTKGEKAITHFEVMNASKKYSCLNVKLETGKKNQIRVHCQEAGYPIVGDTKYGAHRSPIKRLALHARSLEFQHPWLNKSMKFESPIPEEFYKLIQPS